MAMSDENEYLREGFDYKKLTIPQLRGILNKHDIEIPSHVSRKAEYQELYQAKIETNLKTLRKQYLRPNPSSENIHDASPRSRSESPIRRSTRLRSQSPAKQRVQSSGSQRNKRNRAAADETPALTVTSDTAPSVEASPRRRKINKKVTLPNDLEELAPNMDDIQFRGPRTRSRSPVRLSDPDAASTTRSPRRRKQTVVHEPKIEEEEERPRGRTPRRETAHSSGSAAGSASTPSKKSSHNAHHEQDNVFQSSRKRTSDHLGHKEERPHKAHARASQHHSSGPQEPKVEEEVDVMAEFTNFSESELNVPEPEFAEVKPKMETPEKPRSEGRRGFMPSLQALNVSNIFAQRLAPDPVSTPEVSDALPTDTENDADAEGETEATPMPINEQFDDDAEADVENIMARDSSLVDRTAVDDADISVGEVRRHVHQVFFSAVNTALIAFTTLIAVTLLVWWPMERLRQGFCDTTIVPPAREYPWFATFSVGDNHLQQVQDYVRQGVDYIAPPCMECPEHGTCYANNRLVCDEGYVDRRNIGALLGYVAPSCERDVELERLLATLAERAVHVLRHRRARYECDGDVESPSMSEDELYRELLALKAPQLSEEDFKDLWDAVSASLNKYPDVEMVSSRALLFGLTKERKLTQVFPCDCPPAPECADGEECNDEVGCVESSPIFVSHSLAHVNILCRLKLSVFVWLEQRKKTIAYLFSLAVFLGVSSSFLAFRQRHKRRVAKSVDAVIATLRSQQHKADNDRTGRTDRFCVAGPLFETVAKPLRDEVDHVLQRHKDVVYGQKEIKQGEIATIYEWTGL